MRWSTPNPIYGVSLNPWNHSATLGGSSGVAAVACGIIAVGHGNDLGVSLRYPAMCCGVATLRLSLGRVPAMSPTQSTAGIERGPFTQLMAVLGPIARSIADLRAGLQVMSRGDMRDPLWFPATSASRDVGAALIVGYAMNPFCGALDLAVEKAMQTANRGFQSAGARRCEVRRRVISGDVLKERKGSVLSFGKVSTMPSPAHTGFLWQDPSPLRRG